MLSSLSLLYSCFLWQPWFFCICRQFCSIWHSSLACLMTSHHLSVLWSTARSACPTCMLNLVFPQQFHFGNTFPSYPVQGMSWSCQCQPCTALPTAGLWGGGSLSPSGEAFPGQAQGWSAQEPASLRCRRNCRHSSAVPLRDAGQRSLGLRQLLLQLNVRIKIRICHVLYSMCPWVSGSWLGSRELKR